MKALITSYLDIALTERHWTWALIVMAYVVIAFWIRGIFLSPLIRRAKSLDRKYYQEIKTTYSKRSLAGWIFFLASAAFVICVWVKPPTLPFTLKEILVLAGLLLCFGIFILQHLTALGVACVLTLRSVLGLKDDEL